MDQVVQTKVIEQCDGRWDLYAGRVVDMYFYVACDEAAGERRRPFQHVGKIGVKLVVDGERRRRIRTIDDDEHEQ